MDAREATANNADLWAAYLQDQWSLVLDPFGLRRRTGDDTVTRMLAETVAAGVSSFLTLFLSQPVGRMYQLNAPQVTQFVQEKMAREYEHIPLPPQYSSVRIERPSDATQREDWSAARSYEAAGVA